MICSQLSKPFFPRWVYLILDLLYLLIAVLYIIGEANHENITVLKCVKFIPLIIMIVQLIPLRNFSSAVVFAIVGLCFGALGDLLLEISNNYQSGDSRGASLFAAGAGSFLINHLLYVVGYMVAVESICANHLEMKKVLGSLKYLYIALWMVMMIVSFWLVSDLVKNLKAEDDIFRYILPVYATFLLLDAVAGIFLLFMGRGVSPEAFRAGLAIAFGAIIFYVSDVLIAEGRFNKYYQDKVSKSANSFLVMITYYIAQYLIPKGFLWIVIHFNRNCKTSMLKEDTMDSIQM